MGLPGWTPNIACYAALSCPRDGSERLCLRMESGNPAALTQQCSSAFRVACTHMSTQHAPVGCLPVQSCDRLHHPQQLCSPPLPVLLLQARCWWWQAPTPLSSFSGAWRWRRGCRAPPSLAPPSKCHLLLMSSAGARESCSSLTFCVCCWLILLWQIGMPACLPQAVAVQKI